MQYPPPMASISGPTELIAPQPVQAVAMGVPEIMVPSGIRVPIYSDYQLRTFPSIRLREHAMLIARAFSHKNVVTPPVGATDQELLNWILLNQRTHLEPLRPPPQSPQVLTPKPGWGLDSRSVTLPPGTQTPTPAFVTTRGQSPTRWTGPSTAPVARAASPPMRALSPPVSTPLLAPGRSPLLGARPPVSVNIVSMPSVSAPVATPNNALSRIDGVIAAMERELNDDIQSMNSPRGGVEPLGNRSEHDSTVDWLDRQIQNIESRRETCEKRQGYLSDLRRMVHDGGLKSFLSEEGYTPRGRSRLSVLENDHINLRRELRDLTHDPPQDDELAASYVALAEALEKEKLRGDMLQDHLVQSEAALEREHRLGIELDEARTSAEGDLRMLEENSRSVLADCRFLQTKMRDMESGFEGEREELQSRIQTLENAKELAHHPRIIELEKVLEDLRNEHHGHRSRWEEEHGGHKSRIVELEELLRGHEAALQGHANVHSEKDAQLREFERLISGHGESLSEKDAQLKEYLESVMLHQDEKEQHKRRAKELEQQQAMLEEKLAEARQAMFARAETAAIALMGGKGDAYLSAAFHGWIRYVGHSASARLQETRLKEWEADSAQHRERAAELEALLKTHQADSQHHRTRADQLEELLNNHQATFSDQKKQHLSATATLEAELADLRGKHGSHQTRLSSLAKELEDAISEKDVHLREKQSHKSKIGELESLIETLQSGNDNHDRRHGQNRQKISELEQMLEELNGNHSNNVKQLGSHKSQIADLERRIQEYEDEAEGHKRQHSTHRSKIKELEDALLMAEQQGSRPSVAHLSKVQQLQQLLADAELAESGHQQKHSKHEARIRDLEQQLEALENDAFGHKQKHAKYETSIKDLNARIEELVGGEDGHQQRQRDQQRRIVELENLLLDHEAVKRTLDLQLEESRRENTRLKDTEQELRRENARLMSAEQDKLELQRRATTLQSQFEQEKLELQRRTTTLQSQLEKEKSLSDSKGRELEKLKQKSKSMFVAPTQSPRQSTSKRATVSTSDVLSRQRRMTRSSLFGEHVRKGLLGGEFLPGNSDPFVMKVRGACKVVGEALAAATTVHVMAVEKQLEAMVAARSTGRSSSNALIDYTERQVVQSEQRTARSNVEAATHDLKALRTELETHHQLSDRDKKEIKARIQLDMDKCDLEMNLLNNPASVGELLAQFPALVNDLLDVHSNSRVDLNKNWDGGMSPMHHAAHLGRRDLIEYLIERDGGIELLGKADDNGRTPLFYAEKKSPPLFHWLRETKEFMQPLYTSDRRPDVSKIPESHLKLLASIETQGWQSVSWKNGHTMLHWAAHKGDDMVDLCRYLISLEADPNARDGKGKTALNCAMEKQHHLVAAFLREITNVV